MDRSSGDADIVGIKRYHTSVTSPRSDYIDSAIASMPHHQMSPAIVASSHNDKVPSAMPSTIINLRGSGRSSVITLVESLDVMPVRNYHCARQHDREQHRYKESLQFRTSYEMRSFVDFDPMTGQ